VPYGEPADLGWQRIFDAAGIAEFAAAFGSAPARSEYFRYGERGWTRSDAEDAAGSVYRNHFATPEPAADRAVAARAIACLEFHR